MNLLQTIVAHKFKEVAELKANMPEQDLVKAAQFNRPCYSLIKNLTTEGSTGVIAEFKRKSPSKGFINEHADVVEITKGYCHASAAGLSILTDYHFFGGSTSDLLKARVNEIPILRKDFIIDRYQITESKAMGADVILLIAACLTVHEVNTFAAYAVGLGLEVLLELHDEAELAHICNHTTLIGINNRNLKNFEVDTVAAIKMANKIPSNKIKIAESGIGSKQMMQTFKNVGYQGFLIGEMFMKAAKPAEALYNFVKNN